MSLAGFEALSLEQREAIQEFNVTEVGFLDQAGSQATMRKIRVTLHP